MEHPLKDILDSFQVTVSYNLILFGVFFQYMITFFCFTELGMLRKPGKAPECLPAAG